jgi:hypothetical protein
VSGFELIGPIFGFSVQETNEEGAGRINVYKPPDTCNIATSEAAVL